MNYWISKWIFDEEIPTDIPGRNSEKIHRITRKISWIYVLISGVIPGAIPSGITDRNHVRISGGILEGNSVEICADFFKRILGAL